MLRAGKDYLAAIRDGRKIYIGSELVRDVTTHPTFRNAARCFSDIYDRKRSSENVGATSYEENGERYSRWYLKTRDRDGLRKRAEAHPSPLSLVRSDTGARLSASPLRQTARVVATISQPDHQLLQGRSHPEDQRPKDVTRHFGIKRPDYTSAARPRFGSLGAPLVVFFAASPPPLAGSTWFTTEMKREGALWFQIVGRQRLDKTGLLGKAVGR